METTEISRERTYQKRSTAIKIDIASLKTGTFVVKEGFEPSYVDTPYGDVSRINSIGVVVSKSILDESFEIEDGTGRIQIRKGLVNYSDVNIDNFQLGQIVNIIGKVRAFNNEIYIIPEIIKEVKNKKWIEVRKLEFQNLKEVPKKNKLKEEIEEEDIEESNPVFDSILKTIRELDHGEGVDSEMVLEKLDNTNGKEALNKMLELGEVFEIKPGRIKVLD